MRAYGPPAKIFAARVELPCLNYRTSARNTAMRHQSLMLRYLPPVSIEANVSVLAVLLTAVLPRTNEVRRIAKHVIPGLRPEINQDVVAGPESDWTSAMLNIPQPHVNHWQ